MTISGINNGNMEILLTEMGKIRVETGWGRSKKFLLGYNKPETSKYEC